MQPTRGLERTVRVAIRVDSSPTIGGGHAMRCLALARALLGRGCEVLMMHAEDAADAAVAFERAGCRVASLPVLAEETADALAAAEAVRANLGRANWVVLDHYGLGIAWERTIRDVTDAICVVDDLVRPHECDVLVDSSLAVEGLAERYAPLLPAECIELIGPSFAMLRDEFATERLQRARDSRQVKKVVASFGAAESFGLPGLLVDVAPRFADLEFRLILGPSDERAAEYADRAESALNVVTLVNPPEIARELARADLVLGTGGVGLLERIYLGVASATVIVAENQRPQVEAAAHAGLTRNLGEASTLDAEVLTEALERLLEDPEALAAMSERCLATTDGEPGARRVAWELTTRAALDAGPWRLRTMHRDDLDRVRAWRNSPRVRSVMRTADEIGADEHVRWFERGRANERVRRLLLEHKGLPLGYLAFDAESEEPGVWEWGFYLGEETRPSGSGDALGALGLAFAFERIGAREVVGRTLPGNRNSDSFHERLGFARTSGDESVGSVWGMSREAWERTRAVSLDRFAEVDDGS